MTGPGLSCRLADARSYRGPCVEAVVERAGEARLLRTT